MASRLQLRGHRFTSGFISAAIRIRRQLVESVGLVGYSLETQVVRKTFWTVSAWTSDDHLRAFVRTDPHRGASRSFRQRMTSSTFVSWTARAGDLPIGWDEVHRRIETRRADDPVS